MIANYKFGMIYQQIDHNEHSPQENQLYGNNIVLCNPNCMLGPHYYVFIPTFLLLSALLVIIYLNTYPFLDFVWNIVIPSSIVIWMISYLLIGLSNPGIVITKTSTQRNSQIQYFTCGECGVIKGDGVRHCKQCDCCIEGHDHHCPWIGKCVGEQNKVRFYFFLLMMFLTIILLFIGTITSNKMQE